MNSIKWSMTVKKIAGWATKICIPVLVIGFVVGGVVACDKPTADTTPDTIYKLTHSAADAEYILSWDSIVSMCPDIGAFDKQEDFIRRGETKQTSSGESSTTSTLDMDSPAAWGSTRLVFVQKAPAGENFRGFGVWITYCETDEYLDELLLTQTGGFPLQEDGDFVIGVLEQKTPVQYVQLLLAGKHFAVLIMESASSDESLFFGKEKLMELLPTIKGNISSLEITPLPPDIPERERAEEAPYEWHEFMTFRSDELPPPIRVPEEQHYNDLIFSERPLMQVFNFTIDKDWRFVMTATGEIDTKFEVYATVTSSGEGGLSYSSDQVFSLHSGTVTFTREQPLEEGYEPPVNIEIKVFFDLPISWVMTIEK
jgi:hypothetical protein